MNFINGVKMQCNTKPPHILQGYVFMWAKNETFQNEHRRDIWLFSNFKSWEYSFVVPRECVIFHNDQKHFKC